MQRFGVTSFANGADLRDMLKRPNLTISDARALEEQTETINLVDVELGAGGPPTLRRVFYRTERTRPLVVFGTTDAGGNVAFELIGATYTGGQDHTTGTHSYRVDASFRGETKNQSLTLSRNYNVSFIYPENVRQPVVVFIEPKPKSFDIDIDHPDIDMRIRVSDPDDTLTGIPTIFKVWACITRDQACIDVVDISESRNEDNNTGGPVETACPGPD